METNEHGFGIINKRRLAVMAGEEPGEGLGQFFAPIFQVVAAVIFMVMDGGAEIL